MRRLFFVLLFIMVTSCTGCDAVYRLLQKEGAEEKDLLGEVVPGQSSPAVKEIQKLLKLYGYTVGTPDGVLGVNTRTAIRRFQEDNDLEITRFVDYATWEALNQFEPYGLVKGGDLNIKMVQQALQNAKVSPGGVDGKMGRRTVEAVKKFQAIKKLKQDGKIGFKTLKNLAVYLPPPSSVEEARPSAAARKKPPAKQRGSR
ncbi:MAG: peptidoglycan-binding protein [Candidatus Omnitrophota bacterium]|nr:peptidoglycan-binding protein [Candidatus Omnitrophota bacterium]MDZ4241429.1 peptidoglycan-binding protein [Candidatus Omnitrophota bacterium]